jgi:cobalt-zinc-cadmium efflux system outer membrane protein
MTVEQAVTVAVERNLDLVATRYNIPIAEARLITARLRPNPVISVGGDHLKLVPGYNEDTGAGPPEYNVRTDFVLERGGKRQLRIDVAEAGRRVAQLEVLNAMREVVLNVQQAFVEVLQAQADLAVARDNLQTLSEIVRINRSRVQSGDVAEVELIRSQVAELQFENTVRQAELRLRTARARLQLALGRRRGDPLAEAVGEMRREGGQLRLETLREMAFGQRPDLLAQRQERARSQAEVRLQIAQGKVDYVVGTEYRRQQGLAGRGNSLGIFFQADLPVFNRNQGEIARARQEQLQVEARLRAVEAMIETEVETAYLQYDTARRSLTRIEESLLEKARDVRQVTEYSYRRGEATLLELLDAQRAYNETMQAYNEARAEFARSLYTIDAVTGLSTAQGVRP